MNPLNLTHNRNTLAFMASDNGCALLLSMVDNEGNETVYKIHADYLPEIISTCIQVREEFMRVCIDRNIVSKDQKARFAEEKKAYEPHKKKTKKTKQDNTPSLF